jgi:predicted oxidoreductase
MKKTKLKGGLELSRVVHGQMRIPAWNLRDRELLSFVGQLVDMGVTSFDHADIYGNYTCEAILGDALKLKPGLRNSMEIITKCGINLVSDKFPQRKVKHYDYSYDHIIGSVNNSLANFGTDRIDLLLLHRPAPLFDPAEVARAFSVLKRDGKVLHFGVSNFTPGQFEMLASCTDVGLVTNQVEISPWCLEHFENGNIDYFLKEKIIPMAWSPLAGGKATALDGEPGDPIRQALTEVAEELNVAPVEKIVYAWLFKHPASIIPVVGSGKIRRVRDAAGALEIDMSTEQWYRIYTAATGRPVP